MNVNNSWLLGKWLIDNLNSWSLETYKNKVHFVKTKIQDFDNKTETSFKVLVAPRDQDHVLENNSTYVYRADQPDVL